MIAVDTSVMVAYLVGENGPDVQRVDEGLADGAIALPPVVLVELLSDPTRQSAIGPMLTALPRLAVSSGYWVRAAATRSRLLSHRLRARMADTLICQSCLDHNVPLLTRDRDFKHFEKHAGLKLV